MISYGIRQSAKKESATLWKQNGADYFKNIEPFESPKNFTCIVQPITMVKPIWVILSQLLDPSKNGGQTTSFVKGNL